MLVLYKMSTSASMSDDRKFSTVSLCCLQLVLSEPVGGRTVLRGMPPFITGIGNFDVPATWTEVSKTLHSVIMLIPGPWLDCVQTEKADVAISRQEVSAFYQVKYTFSFRRLLTALNGYASHRQLLYLSVMQLMASKQVIKWITIWITKSPAWFGVCSPHKHETGTTHKGASQRLSIIKPLNNLIIAFRMVLDVIASGTWVAHLGELRVAVRRIARLEYGCFPSPLEVFWFPAG